MDKLRKYFRKNMPNMNVEKARAVKTKLALCYAVIGWNVIGFTVYYFFKQAVPKTPNDSIDYAKFLGVQNATVVQYSGFKKVSEFDIQLTEDEIEQFHKHPEAVETQSI